MPGPQNRLIKSESLGYGLGINILPKVCTCESDVHAGLKTTALGKKMEGTIKTLGSFSFSFPWSQSWPLQPIFSMFSQPLFRGTNFLPLWSKNNRKTIWFYLNIMKKLSLNFRTSVLCCFIVLVVNKAKNKLRKSTCSLGKLANRTSDQMDRCAKKPASNGKGRL